jgi:hypothetical protein
MLDVPESDDIDEEIEKYHEVVMGGATGVSNALLNI